MKKIIFIAILLIPSYALALGAGFVGLSAGASGAGASCADSSCTGFLVCQNFEGTGYDNSESWTESCGTGATCDEDSTAALRGSQSYTFTTGSTNSSVTKTYTASDEIYFFTRLNVANDSSSLLIHIRDESSTNVFSIGYSSANNKFIYNTTTLGAACVTGTTYYVWGYYRKGTGADEINRVWVSTTRTKPASMDYEIKDGTSTTQAAKLVLYDSGNGTGATFDQVLLRTTEIGDVCE